MANGVVLLTMKEHKGNGRNNIYIRGEEMAGQKVTKKWKRMARRKKNRTREAPQLKFKQKNK